MATTIHQPPKVRSQPITGSGGGNWRNVTPGDGRPVTLGDGSSTASKTGVWIGLAAITMSFAALTSALVVRQGSASDWAHVILPRILYMNTLLLLVSSVSLELARRRFAVLPAPGRDEESVKSLHWLYVTLGLGALFVAGQYVAWLQLRSEGLYLTTNPNSSFFYLFTAAHALHVLGGLGGLLYVCGKLRRSVLRKNTFDAASHYWHFMGLLWVYLILLLWTKV